MQTPSSSDSKKHFKKSNLLIAGLLILSLIGSFGWFNTRLDLTNEKRYTLSDATVKILKGIKKPMKVTVYLKGDFPASFRQLQNETKFMLQEFQEINPKISFTFIDPIETKMSRDTLEAMGMQPSMLPQMKDGKVSQVILFPYATIQYEGYGSTIPLIIQQRGIDASDQLNRSIENLEYNFMSTMKDMTESKKQNIGFLVNQSELGPKEFGGFIQMALQNYNIGPVIPQAGGELTLRDLPTLEKMQALVVAKPRKAFTDGEKVVLDQYIMHGGRTLFMIDAVNAEMDTLYRAKKIMAYPVDLNLTDFFFNYGLRINPGLVKDMKQAALLRIQAGEVEGNPQYNSFLWPYFPLGIADSPNPITKNINPVKFEFPTSIDTLQRKGIRHTVLFESSNRTIVKPVPNYISLSEIAKTDSLAEGEASTSPRIFAVLTQGKFRSAYAQREESSEVPGFKAESPENKMIVVADGDLARNETLKGKALPLGYDLLTNTQYGNEQFLQNALDFLLDDSNLMSLRDRNLQLRLLDRQRIDDNRSDWQWFNLLLPLFIIGLVGGGFVYWHKRRFAK